jgi:hypothetical protein
MAGLSDNHGLLCLSLSVWNGNDPILKERMFGTTGHQGAFAPLSFLLPTKRTDEKVQATTARTSRSSTSTSTRLRLTRT